MAAHPACGGPLWVLSIRRGIRRSWAPEGTHMAGARRRRCGRLESPFGRRRLRPPDPRGALMRLSTPDYRGLRGEGSIPVPLPPPDCRRPRILRVNSGAIKPVTAAISHLSFGLPIGRVGLLFSERSVSLRSSGLHPFGTVLEIRTFGVTYELQRKEVLPLLSGRRERPISNSPY